jgi:hypothetical protein
MTKRGSNPTGHRARRVGFTLIAVCLVLAALAAHVQAGTGDHAAASPDPVVVWSAVMQATVSHVPDPFLQVRSATIAQVAVFEAVNAIAREYEPYLGGVSAPADASPEAAAIAAAHRALVELYPDRAISLDAQRAASLEAVDDGPAEEAGIAAGEAAAERVLAARIDDGSSTNPPYTPGTEPGDYRPTPPDFTPAFRPGLGQVRTFAIENGAQFRVPPPPPLRSARYTRWKQITDDVDDARIYGGVHYRFDQEEAARQGRRVGAYVLSHVLRPRHSTPKERHR